jgi:hypothetical protein
LRLVLGAAAAVKAGLMRAQIYSCYQAGDDSFEQLYRVKPSAAQFYSHGRDPGIAAWAVRLTPSGSAAK